MYGAMRVAGKATRAILDDSGNKAARAAAQVATGARSWRAHFGGPSGSWFQSDHGIRRERGEMEYIGRHRGPLSMADRKITGEPINDAIARAQQAQREAVGSEAESNDDE